MDIWEHPGGCPSVDEAVVTVGAYDGVHLGHQAVIAQVRARARASGHEAGLITFDQHPARVVRPESAPRLLTGVEHKLELLAATGLDFVTVVRFDRERAQESAEDFVREVLVDCVGAVDVIVGEDFHFGHRRRGNVELLRRMGPDLGFAVTGIELLGVDGRTGGPRVSSTAIREALVEGDVTGAARMLGRPHEVRGVVTHGDKRARDLGFPTANVAVADDLLLPADGIYAGWYTRPDGSRHRAAISLGRRPTFYETAHASLLEPHLLDFDGDLYDEPARVSFVARLRGEERFDSVDDLVAQMGRDCDAARTVLDGG